MKLLKQISKVLFRVILKYILIRVDNMFNYIDWEAIHASSSYNLFLESILTE